MITSEVVECSEIKEIWANVTGVKIHLPVDRSWEVTNVQVVYERELNDADGQWRVERVIVLGNHVNISYMERGVEVCSMPDWLKEFVEVHRPVIGWTRIFWGKRTDED